MATNRFQLLADAVVVAIGHQRFCDVSGLLQTALKPAGSSGPRLCGVSGSSGSSKSPSASLSDGHARIFARVGM